MMVFSQIFNAIPSSIFAVKSSSYITYTFKNIIIGVGSKPARVSGGPHFV